MPDAKPKSRGRTAVPLPLKRAIAERLQRAVVERFETFDAFHKWATAAGQQSLADTVHNWLPPQKRWREKANGAAVRAVDWASCSTPDQPNLVGFCELLGVSADYVLLGRGVPSYGTTRTTENLEAEFRATAVERLADQAVRGKYGAPLRGVRIADVEAVTLLRELVGRIVDSGTAPLTVAIEALEDRVRRELPVLVDALNSTADYYLETVGFMNLRQVLERRKESKLLALVYRLQGAADRRQDANRERLGVASTEVGSVDYAKADGGDRYRMTVTFESGQSVCVDLNRKAVIDWLTPKRGSR